MLLLQSPPVGRGGRERGVTPTSSGRDGGGRGKAIPELIHRAGCSATAILCQQGSMSSTFMMEALIRHRHGCSNPLRREVIRSPRRSGGPWWLLVVGRGLPSKRSLLLGGSAWRTPAKGDGGVLGLDCKFTFCSRMLSVKSAALSLDRNFPRTRIEKAAFNSVPVS
jgi:hypothetical protein